MRCFSSAGIANASDDQSIAWRDLRFVLPAERCCAALQAGDSNSKALPGTTNGSTQHERNTTFPASFASDLDTDTIGLIVFAVALMIFFGPLRCHAAEVPAGVNWSLFSKARYWQRGRDPCGGNPHAAASSSEAHSFIGSAHRRT